MIALLPAYTKGAGLPPQQPLLKELLAQLSITNHVAPFFSNAEQMPLKARFCPCLSLNQTDYELYQKVAESSPADRASCAATEQHPRRIS